ncbi:MAG: hypothetical protein VKO21_10840 [Candidatus Sericytochromatia bacterium]|nr:hypothetical protein [Candidatus Sericytochromatia bacterium]
MRTPTDEAWLAAGLSRLAAAPVLFALRGLMPEGAVLVGGCVRDALLGRPLHDVDLAVPCPVAPLARAWARALGATHVVLDESYDSHRLVLRGGHMNLDVTRYQGNTLEEDLRRRDLTVNALAVRVSTSSEAPLGPFVDVCDGLGDLAAGRLCAPDVANWEADPLRLLRVYRLLAELGFHVTDDTRAEVRARVPLLSPVPGERVWAELQRLVAGQAAAEAWNMLGEDGLLRVLGWPEQGGLWCVFPEPLDPEGRLRVQLLGGLTVQDAERLSTRLRWPRSMGRSVQALLRGAELWPGGPWPDRASRLRWLHRLRVRLEPLGLAHARELYAVFGGDAAYAACTSELQRAELRPHQPPVVRGDEILRVTRRPAGRWLAQLLQELAEEQAVGTLTDADEAWRWLEGRLT